jgi:chemotaxis protein methyltransferase CheR
MTISQNDFVYLSDLIRKNSGIHLTEDKMYLLEARLLPLAQNNDMENITDLVNKSKTNPKIVSDIVEVMTTNESLFFRDTKPFETLTKNILPHIIEKNNNPNKEIKIWSAACSTGQEPYSVALAIKEDPELSKYKFSIHATDLSNKVLEKAQNGLYTQFEIQRGLPIMVLMKYFTQEENGWRINDEIRNMVTFKAGNLLTDTHHGVFDVVMCRNVLIYFEPETKRLVIDNIIKQMHDNSVLFLGVTESIIGIVDDVLQRFDKNLGVFSRK